VSLTRPQLDAIVHALAIVLPARAPADQQLRAFFRDNRKLGSRERALVADTVYAALRRRRLLEKLTPNASRGSEGDAMSTTGVTCERPSADVRR